MLTFHRADRCRLIGQAAPASAQPTNARRSVLSLPDGEGTGTGRWRRVLPAALTLMAFLLVWFVLVLPQRLFRLTP
ncbi:MAG: hypothetical protein ACLGI3_08710, partial [Actinomycetes bacterium]